MKQIFFSFTALYLSCSIANSQTATDFTVTDCNGVSHNLFSELDAEKIVVIAWVMPCGACASASLAAYTAVESYATSNPNRVFFYLVDDVANTTCSTLTTWGNTNAMPNATKFSNSAISMGNYGTPGMPKIVVIGGTNHSIGFNQNSGVTTLGVQQAINTFLSSTSTGELEESIGFKAKVVPNPVKGNLNISYSLDNASTVKIEIFSLNGELVFQTEEKTKAGEQNFSPDPSVRLDNGMYVLKITNASHTESVSFVVDK